MDIDSYINYCINTKQLSENTITAYKTDLSQYFEFLGDKTLTEEIIDDYVQYLNSNYKYKTVKRKVACVKAYYRYLHKSKLIKYNLWREVEVESREPATLPKTIPLDTIRKMIQHSENAVSKANDDKHLRQALRDDLVLKILFLTGVRVSELCDLRNKDIDLNNRTARITGKGNKERIIYLENDGVIEEIKAYRNLCGESEYLLLNRSLEPLSAYATRDIIHKYAKLSGYTGNITPHMFRHTFATSLLDKYVDIRYIQNFLGHSSITTTQIYTRVTTGKCKSILWNKHPLNQD